MSNDDFAALADLVRAGEILGLRPYPGESPDAFAARIAVAIAHRDEQRRHVARASRVVITAALAAFGIFIA